MGGSAGAGKTVHRQGQTYRGGREHGEGAREEGGERMGWDGREGDATA